MRTLSVPADRAVDPLTVEILRKVRSVAATCTLEYMLVGAMARDFMLLHVHGIDPVRATRDIDVAIAVRSWSEFQSYSASLIETGDFERDAEKPHRFRYKTPGSTFAYPLDILPFGAIQDETGAVRFPVDGDREMNVMGYEDAAAAAVDVQIADDLVVRTVSLPGLATLKFFAWKDRGFQGSSKDAVDLATLILNYARAGNDERLWADHMAELDSVGYDLEIAGAYLMGRDVRRMCSDETSAALVGLLSEARNREILALDMVREHEGRRIGLAELEERLEQFVAGLSGDNILPRP